MPHPVSFWRRVTGEPRPTHADLALLLAGFHLLGRCPCELAGALRRGSRVRVRGGHPGQLDPGVPEHPGHQVNKNWPMFSHHYLGVYLTAAASGLSGCGGGQPLKILRRNGPTRSIPAAEPLRRQRICWRRPAGA